MASLEIPHLLLHRTAREDIPALAISCHINASLLFADRLLTEAGLRLNRRGSCGLVLIAVVALHSTQYSEVLNPLLMKMTLLQNQRSKLWYMGMRDQLKIEAGTAFGAGALLG